MNKNLDPVCPGPEASAVETSEGDASHSPRHETQTADILPYVVPMFAYVALGGIEGYVPDVDGQPSPVWYPVAYTVRLVIVATLAWRYRKSWADLRPAPSVPGLLLALGSGLIVTLLWIGLDGLYPGLPFLGKRVSFDPTRMAHAGRLGFYAARLTGLVLLVPLIEELFWRSFLNRWLIDRDFQRVPIGRVTLMSGAVTSLLFALAHPEWLPALLTGVFWAWLLHQTRSLSACVISHLVANLALGVYVILYGAWKFW
jgi:CAAX prenyl protease-like protein